VKFRQIQLGAAMAASFQPPPEAVTTTLAERAEWPTSLRAIGTAVAVNGVTVSADLPGLVQQIAFESGASVARGDLLVRLDTRQEEAQLQAAESQRDLAKLNLERISGLHAEGIASNSDFDRVVAEHRQAEARVGELQATLERKRIRAPFTGVLGIRQVDLGQYLSGGSPIVALQSLDPIHVDFSVPQQEVSRLRAGGKVQVSIEGAESFELAGRISAVDSVVDAATRNVRVQATLANPSGRLRPGMFVRVELGLGAKDTVVALPASAVSFAPYGNSVFVVSELKGPAGESYRGVTQKFVSVGPTRGDLVGVTAGIEPGQEVVTSGAFKLRSGAAVKVDNKVQPSANAAPRPEDN
jgi:membrane fusion protein (multidrug efflux system)